MTDRPNDQLAITGKRGAPTRIDAVVFDFDDTLAETLPARVAAMSRTFKLAGIRQDGATFMREHRGIPVQVSLPEFDGGRGEEMGLLDLYRTAYWHKERGLLRLFDGVRELMEALASVEVKAGVFTSKGRDMIVGGRPGGVVVELAELGLGYLTEHTIGYEDVTNPKPHPEGVELLLGMLDVSPDHMLVVGDSHADILAGQAAGCWSCLAGWGVAPAERTPDVAIADVVAEHPDALTLQLPGWR